MKITAMRRVLAATLLLVGGNGWANDFPTIDRVLYVQECVRNHPGPYYEMINKCSCALDALARQVSFDEYMTMSTATNANSIGGERGGYIRDAESLQVQIRRFRDLQNKVKQGCFINVTSPR
jgi:hypothetical protein